MPKQRIWARRIVVGCLLFGLLSCLGGSVFVIVERQRVRRFTTTVGMFFDAPQYVWLRSAEQMLNYIDQNREDVSLVVYSVNVEGEQDLGQSHIFHNADVPMPMASIETVIVLAAYARAIVAGEIDSAETLTLAEWDQYHLPDTNDNAHLIALNALNIETDDFGYALDGNQAVTVAQLVDAMIVYGDNAAPEWLINRLGYTAIQSVVDQLDLHERLRLLPYSGLLLTLQNHEQPELTSEHLEALIAMERSAFETLVWETQQQLLNDTMWGEAARDFWQEDVVPRDRRLEMQAFDQLSARGTARDFATIMAGVATDTLFSAEVSQIMRSHLEWVTNVGEDSAQFHMLGSAGGSRLGITTEATYFVSQDNEYANRPRVAVLLMRDVPFAAWRRFNNVFAHQLFKREVASSAAFSEQVHTTLED